jgi:toxin HigB-1
VIESFADDATNDVFDGFNTKKARKRLDTALFPVASRKLDMINAALDLEDLKIPPSNHLEALKGNLKGKHSIRINVKYRIVFRWTAKGAEEVEITDYHK